MAAWVERPQIGQEIAYRPARVLMQDFTGVPAVVDLAAMRDAMVALGGDPKRINPLVPVDLVIDHSVQVDAFASRMAFERNVELEYERNGERYAFLRWGSKAFDNFRVVPPGTGICHQVNLEYLAQVVWTAPEGNRQVAYPDTLVGTDSHTTMVNGLSRAGLGRGRHRGRGRHAGPAGLDGDPRGRGLQADRRLARGYDRNRPRADGHPDAAQEGCRRQVRRVLRARRRQAAARRPGDHRQHGAGVWRHLRLLPDRRCDARLYAPHRPRTRRGWRWSRPMPRRKACGARTTWRTRFSPTRWSSISAPSSRRSPAPSGRRIGWRSRRPRRSFEAALPQLAGDTPIDATAAVSGTDLELRHGDVVIAAITSCTNTSNPGVMIAAGLVAKKAVEHGLTRKPWVKTSLAPGSRVVTNYLDKAGLTEPSERRSASTWSAMAAPPASATRDRCPTRSPRP